MCEGFPPRTSPQDILDGLIYKHAIELEAQRDIAQTVIASLIALTNGGEYLDLVGHLYPPDMKKKKDKAEKEAKELNMSTAVLNRFTAIAENWEE